MPTYDYIDSNIIIETLSEAKYKEYCELYLYRLTKFRNPLGTVSFLTMGEILYFISKMQNVKRDFVVEKLLDKLRPLNLVGLKEETSKISSELMELDYNLKNEPADALHLAIAITNKADRFVTLEDRKFNQTLRNFMKQRGVKIVTLIKKSS